MTQAPPDPALRAERGGIYAEDPVREAVQALLMIAAWGLQPSSRAETWAIARRALSELNGDPMTPEGAAGFMARVTAARATALEVRRKNHFGQFTTPAQLYDHLHGEHRAMPRVPATGTRKTTMRILEQQHTGLHPELRDG